MNQLEHLKALRDKARVQTEQAKAVLKQQGEITESLDRLIAALEGEEGPISAAQSDSISAAKDGVKAAVAADPHGVAAPEKKEDRDAGSLGQLISNLEKKVPGEIAAAGAVVAAGAAAIGAGKDEIGAKGDSASPHSEVLWVEEDAPVIPAPRKVPSERMLPKLDPIVWEVAEAEPLPVGRNEVSAESGLAENAPDSEAPPVETGGEGDTETGAISAVGGIAAAAGAAVVGGLDCVAEQKEDAKFKFLKFSREKEASATEVVEKTAPAIPPPSGSILSDSETKASQIEEAQVEEANDPVPVAGADPSEDTVAINPSLAKGPEPGQVEVVLNEETVEEISGVVVDENTGLIAGVIEEVVMVEESVVVAAEESGATTDSAVSAPSRSAVIAPPGTNEPVEETETAPVEEAKVVLPPPPVAVSSNIFFDANSAYLKDSELTKIHTIADAVSGAESRLVKIQGLEDLASSNDFKVLLASRRMLAVKKKLADKGVGGDQMVVNEIKLSPEGRVLEPPSILITPPGA